MRGLGHKHVPTFASVSTLDTLMILCFPSSKLWASLKLKSIIWLVSPPKDSSCFWQLTPNVLMCSLSIYFYKEILSNLLLWLLSHRLEREKSKVRSWKETKARLSVTCCHVSCSVGVTVGGWVLPTIPRGLSWSHIFRTSVQRDLVLYLEQEISR